VKTDQRETSGACWEGFAKQVRLEPRLKDWGSDGRW